MAPVKRFDKRWAMSLATEDKCLIEALAAQNRQSEGEVVRRLVQAEAERVGLYVPIHGRAVLRDMSVLAPASPMPARG